MKTTINVFTSLAKVLSRSWAVKRELQREGVPVLRKSPPILYFGSLPAYFASPLRVVTAALNPSSNEFPDGTPALRFPGACERYPERHFEALNNYFEHAPYWEKWFKHADVLLDGLGVGFRAGRSCRDLHTDLCSPLATQPAFTDLTKWQQDELERKGMPLWSDLIQLLDPDVIIMSGAGPLRDRVPLFANAGWECVYGTGRKGAWLAVIQAWGRQRLGVFALTNHVPFGNLSLDERRRVGKIIKKEACRRQVAHRP